VALGACTCQVPSWSCSTDAAGRGTHGPTEHTSAAARHGCHHRIEVPARPSWGPCPTGLPPPARGLEAPLPAPVSHWPPSLLQLSAEGAGGQREKPPSSLLQERLLASSKRGNRSPALFPLQDGKSWVSYRSPQSLWAAPWSGSDWRPEAGQGLCFASPPSSLCPLPPCPRTSSAAGCSARSRLSAPASLPGSARQGRSPPLVPGGQVSLLEGEGMAATALCLPCRL